VATESVGDRGRGSFSGVEPGGTVLIAVGIRICARESMLEYARKNAKPCTDECVSSAKEVLLSDWDCQQRKSRCGDALTLSDGHTGR